MLLCLILIHVLVSQDAEYVTMTSYSEHPPVVQSNFDKVPINLALKRARTRTHKEYTIQNSQCCAFIAKIPYLYHCFTATYRLSTSKYSMCCLMVAW